MILTFIGTTELLLIGGLALLLFGGKKLPEMMRGLGKGVREFKDGMNDVTGKEGDASVEEAAEAEASAEPKAEEQLKEPGGNGQK